MTFRKANVSHRYSSLGGPNFADDFMVPLLKISKRYDRTAGYFSSSVLKILIKGVQEFVNNRGKMRLVVSPTISNEDINAIMLGYEKRETVVWSSAVYNFDSAISELDDLELSVLSEMISKSYLDIKIAVTKDIGIFHDKLGILEDKEGNVVVFFGSANETAAAYQSNYETVRVLKSWDNESTKAIEDEVREFEQLWSNQSPFLEVYEFRDAAKNSVLKTIENRCNLKISLKPVTLRDYQNEAIEAWISNSYRGFFIMATGTGKTWTALYASKALIEKNALTMVIIAPYKHLIKQWEEDVKKLFPTADIVLISSENPKWEIESKRAIIKKKHKQESQIIIISTMASFQTLRFQKILAREPGEKLLIVDEAHRFSKREEWIKNMFPYLLGLSATPSVGRSANPDPDLVNFFGGVVYDLPIEKALGKYLVNYYYKPIFVQATKNEEEKFLYHTRQMMSCFIDGRLVDKEKFNVHRLARQRVIALANEKTSRLETIISSIHEKDHIIVYCGDGRLFDERGEEVRHITFVKSILDKLGHKTCQFTAQENMLKRMELVDAFNKNEVNSMAAIRCLDEGINIPSIKAALILASNDNYRETVQRRGRILRQYPGKNEATIYDVIVLPSDDSVDFAKVELRRFFEYSRLAINSIELDKMLDKILCKYGLGVEDIQMVDDQEREDIDE